MQTLLQTPFLGISLGGPEMIILVCLILLLFGAKRLPQLARSIGRSSGEFRRGKAESEHERVGTEESDADKKKIES